MREYNGIINISEPEDDYSIYKMYSSDENDTSIYIGVSSNPKARVYKHSMERKYSKNSHKPLYNWLNYIIDDTERKVYFEVIERELNEEVAFSKEIYYIQLYKDLGYNVLNISGGGKGNTGREPWNKGKSGHLNKSQVKSLSEAHKGQISAQRKTIYKYNKEMCLIKTYLSTQEAGLMEKCSPESVGSWCKGTRNPKNGFIWSFEKLN